MYESTKIAETIKNTAKTRNVQLKIMLEDLDLNKNTLSNMYNGSMLKGDSLAKIADYLDCSVDYLLGRVNTPNGTYSITGDNNVQVNGNNSPTTVTTSEHSQQDTITEEFIQTFKTLTLADKIAVMDFAMSKVNK